MNIIPYNEQDSKLSKYGGIDKLIILALAPNANESYANLKTLFSLINLNGLCGVVDFCISSDLKCIMVLLGLQTCTATHPCPWCNAKNTNLLKKGEARTFRGIKENFLEWEKSGHGKKLNAKNYGNLLLCVCVNM